MNFESKIYKCIGNNVRKFRLKKGYSQEKLSDLLDTNLKFIGHVERCERCISLKKLIQLAQILEIEVSQFFISDN